MSYNHLSNVKTVWYNDIPFKSMIETKWYSLYSKLGIDIFYEPTSFTLLDEEDNVMYKQYTPDLYIPEWDMYHEIKLSTYPTIDEFKKCYYLSLTLKKKVLITWLDISSKSLSGLMYDESGDVSILSLGCCPLCKTCGWVKDGTSKNLNCSHDIDEYGSRSIFLQEKIRSTLQTKFIRS